MLNGRSPYCSKAKRILGYEVSDPAFDKRKAGELKQLCETH
jgi:hypothetical protein